MEPPSNPTDTYDPHAVAERLRAQAVRYRNMGDINAATEAEQAAAAVEIMGDSDDARRVEQTFDGAHGGWGVGLSPNGPNNDLPNASGNTGDETGYSGAASGSRGSGDVSTGVGSSSGPGPSASDENNAGDEGGDDSSGEIEERGPVRYLP